MTNGDWGKYDVPAGGGGGRTVGGQQRPTPLRWVNSPPDKDKN